MSRTIILALLFAALVVTEFGGPGVGDFKGQQQVKDLMTKIFDNDAVFDDQETSRMEINTAE